MSRLEAADTPKAGLPDTLHWLERFEAAWQSETPPQLPDFLPAAAAGAPPGAEPARRALLEELVKIDLHYRWRRGSAEPGGLLPAQPQLEDYVACYPELGPLERLSPELIAEEYRVRQRWGDQPPAEAYSQRFPQQADRLRDVLARMEGEL